MKFSVDARNEIRLAAMRNEPKNIDDEVIVRLIEEIEELEASRDSRQLSAVPSEEEMRWRKLLWWNHGCRPTHYLYGDDGELQCNLCGIDFKRATLDDLERGVAG